MKIKDVIFCDKMLCFFDKLSSSFPFEMKRNEAL